MKIKHLIAHLRQLPQDLEVWQFWDESGECWEAKHFPCRIEIVQKGHYKSSSKKVERETKWEFLDNTEDAIETKEVLMMGLSDDGSSYSNIQTSKA